MKTSKMRFAVFIVCLTFLFSVPVILPDANAGRTEYFSSPRTYVVTSGVNYRVAPNKNSQKYGTLKKGQTVMVSGIVKDWYEIVLQNGGNAYAWNTYLAPANLVTKASQSASTPEAEAEHACGTIPNLHLGDFPHVEDQVFDVKLKPYGRICFFISEDQEYDNDPIKYKPFIIPAYGKGKDAVFEPEDIGGGEAEKCEIKAISFSDMDGNGLKDVIVVASCRRSASGWYNNNRIYYNKGKSRRFQSDMSMDRQASKFSTVAQIKKNLRGKKVSPAPAPLISAQPTIQKGVVYKDYHVGWTGRQNLQNKYFFNVTDDTPESDWTLAVSAVTSGCGTTSGSVFMGKEGMRGEVVGTWNNQNTACYDATDQPGNPNKIGLTPQLVNYAKQKQTKEFTVDVSRIVNGNGRYAAEWKYDSGCCAAFVTGMELRGQKQARLAASTEEIKLDDALREKLISLFYYLEAGEVTSFRRGSVPPDKDMISFAMLCLDNLGELGKIDASYNYRVPVQRVDKITMRYFGRKVEPRSVADSFTCRNGYYVIPSTGASGPDIDIVGFHPLGNNLYEVYAKLDDESPGKQKVVLKMESSDRFMVVEYMKPITKAEYTDTPYTANSSLNVIFRTDSWNNNFVQNGAREYNVAKGSFISRLWDESIRDPNGEQPHNFMGEGSHVQNRKCYKKFSKGDVAIFYWLDYDRGDGGWVSLEWIPGKGFFWISSQDEDREYKLKSGKSAYVAWKESGSLISITVETPDNYPGTPQNSVVYEFSAN
ncbi:SH3 domain-containing protein [Desulfonema magnum]|uniref:SH3 domain-containing protein n=1 Tax=Desulfonema magnum TaxID=45655 RepID=A0A975BH36_9BACT|nr:SH3 domain-containing protein [Desulfonema magnum]QTA85178.1 SH3 domain-containing protein [Desulfonema magnum]